MTDLTNNQRIYLSASLVALPLFVLWSWRQRRLNAIEAAEMAQTSPKTVVVIGASWAGINTTHGLLKEVPSAKVVLINPSDEFYFNIASPRLVSKPGEIPREKYIYPIAPLFDKYPNAKKNFEFVQGKATAIDLEGKNVSVQESTGTSRTIAYDYLVIASGSTSNATTGTGSFQVPFKQSSSTKVEAELKTAQETIKSAKSIIIGGAGAVGVEFAGELAEARPDLEITLVTNTDNVLFGLREPTRQKAAKILKQKKVKILTNKAVTSAAPDSTTGKWTVTTADGQTLTADIYVSTVGVVPNNEFIPASLLNKDGWVEVDTHFASKANSSVYAVGDITHYSARLVSRVAGQVSVLISNLKADITGKGKRGVYKTEQSLMVVMPMGKSTGTGQLGNFTPPGFLVSFVKGKDYFTGSGKKFIAG
ncbi:AMID-like mitochondrial oxidoreductase, putative [Talaromyces stipitatus ATCC 10500]|uniref:AMID-like mitochondrial oxidoreductase, putative n=1 Tax=Talaromyces stipitatus (strain ATCC 10500 / CBS 375.48 / QM 6759 / NRRL 1006) TaxID=441959 RepID=B8M9H5_TALSN|nr:AMID-like mitochondrial oxidoreductase, putative [Talaromyces stipitatus ATCC 10500]XP_002481728.1 AMID-like mitochondrial oxidoreductase, putative [Talaromyces stipitatus ATCC 10500]EED17735.1 AMID-like mitochondrial oxidoreductase, putative [Talaromyces stipitatus ATCC 10500]EED17736.1 AMID-like mitochondrial oxidoreductase, putative [Talaromyces stipitatus ATCC 10500]